MNDVITSSVRPPVIDTGSVTPLTCSNYPCLRFHDGQLFEMEKDELAVETAVAMVYNGVAHTVQMCSAIDLEDLAVGFSVTEGIVDKAKDIQDIEVVSVSNGIEVRMTLANRHFERLKRARRNMSGRTGCGICGTESLQHVIRKVEPVSTSTFLSYAAVERALLSFKKYQVLNQLTGSTHAAAYISAEGEILAIREDVGRHNALDKLIGHYLKSDLQNGAILVSSRASFEMVQKAAAANVGILLAISGATSMAVDLSDTLNLTLAAYCRTGRMNLYTHAYRIQFSD
ncbi:formate dehydrogenase accessory sulfurtransferase FdhD [Psychromonas sp. CD1]|uniref:formate dehydrogenase accessory sulfurtransferase FdhD n=1 Tax=Psychromonas sp. CD1 TaxID=1979839 RepID=UPI000B9A994C|nr:formate dehydrogenase accessory sulfurtransferase FdhD [Psychromonas sp. CD1]